MPEKPIGKLRSRVRDLALSQSSMANCHDLNGRMTGHTRGPVKPMRLTQIGTADFCHPATNILKAYLLAESLFENCLDYHPIRFSVIKAANIFERDIKFNSGCPGQRQDEFTESRFRQRAFHRLFLGTESTKWEVNKHGDESESSKGKIKVEDPKSC